MSDKSNRTPRERHPAIWNAAYGAAFVSSTMAGFSSSSDARLCAQAREKANAAVEALEAHDAALGSDDDT